MARMPKSLGKLLLAIWLIATGAIPLLQISFAYSGHVMSGLAIAAGILILLDR
jgi:hypothetical protein